MNCADFQALLEPFHDGELDGRRMREAAIHLAACEECSRQLAQYERMQSLLAKSLDAELSGVDDARIWAGIEEGIEQDVPGQSSPWRVFQMAAATTRVRGIGPRPDRLEAESLAGVGDDGEAIWLHAPEPAGRRASGGLFRGGMALAAGVLLALLLFGEGNQQAGPEVAVQSPVVEPARDAVRSVAASPKQPLAKTVVAAAQRPARSDSVHEVQIHSLNDFGGEMAMWAAPAGDTAVIWLGDGAPRARR